MYQVTNSLVTKESYKSSAGGIKCQIYKVNPLESKQQINATYSDVAFLVRRDKVLHIVAFKHCVECGAFLYAKHEENVCYSNVVCPLEGIECERIKGQCVLDCLLTHHAIQYGICVNIIEETNDITELHVAKESIRINGNSEVIPKDNERAECLIAKESVDCSACGIKEQVHYLQYAESKCYVEEANFKIAVCVKSNQLSYCNAIQQFIITVIKVNTHQCKDICEKNVICPCEGIEGAGSEVIAVADHLVAQDIAQCRITIYKVEERYDVTELHITEECVDVKREAEVRPQYNQGAERLMTEQVAYGSAFKADTCECLEQNSKLESKNHIQTADNQLTLIVHGNDITEQFAFKECNERCGLGDTEERKK